KIDDNDRWMGVIGGEPPRDGRIYHDFAKKQATEQLVLFPGIVVQRAAYEETGGFCTSFQHVTDWDMWFRVGRTSPISCVPHPLALFRVHAESHTKGLLVSAGNVRESYFVVKSNLARMNGSENGIVESEWRSRLARAAVLTAWELDKNNCTLGRFNQ